MENLDPPTESPRRISVSSFIAWLSLCLLAAAWGRTLDDRWQETWSLAGVFGLASAVGLGTLEKTRLVREKRAKRVRELASRTTLDGRLARQNEQSAALETIDDAILRLTKHVASERKRQAYNPARGNSPLTLSNFPLEVTPVNDDGDAFDLGAAHSIAGSLRTISSSVVSFEHDQTFTERVVLLTFTLGKREKLCFVVDIIWTQILKDRSVSSGAVMAVGVPADQVSEIALVESRQDV